MSLAERPNSQKLGQNQLTRHPCKKSASNNLAPVRNGRRIVILMRIAIPFPWLRRASLLAKPPEEFELATEVLKNHTII